MYTKEEVEYWFKRLEGEPSAQAAKFKKLHDAARTFALACLDVLPHRHEAVRAMDAIQESVQWGNTAIARDGSATGVQLVGAMFGCDKCFPTGVRCDECQAKFVAASAR